MNSIMLFDANERAKDVRVLYAVMKTIKYTHDVQSRTQANAAAYRVSHAPPSPENGAWTTEHVSLRSCDSTDV